MTKPKFPRMTDNQFYDYMQPYNDEQRPYAACWECNIIISVAEHAADRIAALKHHDTHNARHLAFVAAEDTDPEEEV